jgi:hypothetical protein
MTRASYNPSTDTIRADLASDARPAVVHAGREGHAVVLHLTQPEAVHLMNQLKQAILWAERAKQGR